MQASNYQSQKRATNVPSQVNTKLPPLSPHFPSHHLGQPPRNMDDHLGLAVIAILRDRAISDLQADNRRLRVEGPTCTVLLTGADGNPTFATGTFSMCRCLRAIAANADSNINHGLRVRVAVDRGGAAATYRLGLVPGSCLVLKKEAGLGPDVVQKSGTSDDVTRSSIRARDGRLEIVIFWNEPGLAFEGFVLDVPVPSELSGVEDIAEGGFMPVPPGFWATNANTLVRFKWAVLNAKVLFETLAGGDGS